MVILYTSPLLYSNPDVMKMFHGDKTFGGRVLCWTEDMQEAIIQ